MNKNNFVPALITFIALIGMGLIWQSLDERIAAIVFYALAILFSIAYYFYSSSKS